MKLEQITKENIILEISELAFSDEDSNIKTADKLRALSLLNTIIKDDNQKSLNETIDKFFVDDLDE